MVGRPAPWARRALAAAGARSQLPARAVASPIAGGGAHLGTSGLHCSQSSPSSVELVPRPVLGGCGLGCEVDETSGGRGFAAEINWRVSSPAGPRGPRNPNLKPLGNTLKSRDKGSATSDPATPRLPVSLLHTRRTAARPEAAVRGACLGGPSLPLARDLPVTVEPMSFRRA